MLPIWGGVYDLPDDVIPDMEDLKELDEDERAYFEMFKAED